MDGREKEDMDVEARRLPYDFERSPWPGNEAVDELRERLRVESRRVSADGAPSSSLKTNQ